MTIKCVNNPDDTITVSGHMSFKDVVETIITHYQSETICIDELLNSVIIENSSMMTVVSVYAAVINKIKGDVVYSTNKNKKTTTNITDCAMEQYNDR